MSSARRPATVVRLAVLVLATNLCGCGLGPGRTVLPGAGTAVPLAMVEGHPVVQVMVNDQGPYPFLLDTGVSCAMAVYADLARELRLPRAAGTVRVHAADGGTLRLPAVRVGRLRLGEAEFAEVPAVVIPAVKPEVRGFLGMGLFERGLLTLDFPGGRAEFRPGRLGGADVGRSDTLEAPFDGGVPTVPVSVPLKDGGRRTVRVILDSGSNGGLDLPETLAPDLATYAEPVGQTVYSTLVGERVKPDVRVRGVLRLGKAGATDPVVSLVPGDGAIGTDALSAFRVTIDRRGRKVRLVLVGPLVPGPDSRPVAGLGTGTGGATSSTKRDVTPQGRAVGLSEADGGQ